jgi:hypothetical protein
MSSKPTWGPCCSESVRGITSLSPWSSAKGKDFRRLLAPIRSRGHVRDFSLGGMKDARSI